MRFPTALALLSIALLPTARGFAQDDERAPAATRAVEPPSRTLARALTSLPRLAGTPGSEPAIELVARTLSEAGFQVERDQREVLLSYPRRLRVDAEDATGATLFVREDHFDPDAWPPQDVPLFHGWSASGTAEGPVVDVGHGLRADFESLASEGFELRGAIVLARYGRGYRGVKVELAEEFGCAGVLLFNDPAVDGPARGDTWPEGPWKPPWDAERGAIASIARGPGDPSTPGWPSAAPGAEGRRLTAAEAAPRLPRIPSLPIGSEHAERLLSSSGARVRLHVDAPRTLRPIVNVVGRLAGSGEGLVLAGNHRDSWVRGAQDAASGTVSLLRAATKLGMAVRNGWRPRSTIVLGFWDAEEFGLIGSTEWAEAHADELRRNARVYVNADAVVAGLRVRVSGTPGLEPLVEEALARVPAPGRDDATLADQWRASQRGSEDWSLGLLGSGSDYTVFLHHLGIPVLDVSFGGNRAGQYHTRFDDFELMDRWLDPTWEGHETAGTYLAAQLRVFADAEDVFDDARAARAMAAVARRAAAEEAEDGRAWLGSQLGSSLAGAFDELADAIEAADGVGGPDFHQTLQRSEGLAERPWYRNVLWAPGLETGYGSETLPTLRRAARQGETERDLEASRLLRAIEALTQAWKATGPGR